MSTQVKEKATVRALISESVASKVNEPDCYEQHRQLTTKTKKKYTRKKDKVKVIEVNRPTAKTLKNHPVNSTLARLFKKCRKELVNA